MAQILLSEKNAKCFTVFLCSLRIYLALIAGAAQHLPTKTIYIPLQTRVRLKMLSISIILMHVDINLVNVCE